MEKLLTIAIPTFNRAEYLDKLLEWLAGAIKGFDLIVKFSSLIIALVTILQK